MSEHELQSQIDGLIKLVNEKEIERNSFADQFPRLEQMHHAMAQLCDAQAARLREVAVEKIVLANQLTQLGEELKLARISLETKDEDHNRTVLRLEHALKESKSTVEKLSESTAEMRQWLSELEKENENLKDRIEPAGKKKAVKHSRIKK